MNPSAPLAEQARGLVRPGTSEPSLRIMLGFQGTALFAHDPESRMPGAGSAASPLRSNRSATTVSRTIHAVLVGIDRYPDPIPQLSGCVNDIEAFATYLRERVDKDNGVALRLKVLKNQQATRAAVIAALQSHFRRAKQGDVALFYFSGHGSQERAPEEFWKIEPDHLNETLVCHDSRMLGSWGLADKELAQLIGEIAGRGPHVAVVLDCCHSGSGTREAEVVRRIETDSRPRPIESYIVATDQVLAAAARAAGPAPGTGWQLAAKGRHVLFAACASDQEAKEYSGGGKRRAPSRSSSARL